MKLLSKFALATTFALLPSFALAQSVDCDATIKGFKGFAAAQSELDQAVDTNSDGKINVCFESAFIYDTGSTAVNLRIDRPLNLIGTQGTSFIYSSANYSRSLMITASDVTVDNLYLYAAGDFSRALSLGSTAKRLKVSNSFFYAYGYFSIGLDAGAASQIDYVESSNFITYPYKKSADQGFATGLGVSGLSSVGRITNSNFINIQGTYVKAIEVTSYSHVGRIDSIQITGNGTGIGLNQDSRISRISNVSMSGVRSGIDNTQSQIGTIEKVSVSLVGSSARGLTLVSSTYDARVANVSDFTVVGATETHSNGIYLFKGKLSNLSNFNFESNGPYPTGIYNVAGQIDNLDDFIIVNKQTSFAPIWLYSISSYPAPKIGILSNGTIVRPAGAVAINGEQYVEKQINVAVGDL